MARATFKTYRIGNYCDCEQKTPPFTKKPGTASIIFKLFNLTR